VALGALVAAAMAAGIAVVAWGFWGDDATEPAPAATLDVTVVSPPETLDPSVQTTVSEQAERVETPASVEADAGAALQTPEAHVRERSQTGRVNATRKASEQAPLRKHNPYR
jgi:hypothetical protein